MRKVSRASSSWRICWAMMAWPGVKVSPRRNRRASFTDRSESWAMLRPPTVTARLSGFSRLPWQAGQGVRDM